MSSVFLGLDIGSTTVKTIAIDEGGNTLFAEYGRHHSDARNKLASQLKEVMNRFPDAEFAITLTGSGAMNFAEDFQVEFVQEVIAASRSIRHFIPETDVVIELGGEDGKITFFDKPGVDQRMNESCAGGTGAFIDQMASVLRVETTELNTLAAKHHTLYPIAARCGVFAKTDIMPLLNEGAPKEDIAASVLQAVVDQVVGGLACGRTIKGKVAFLGGPLFFLPELRKRFIETLKLPEENVIFPDNALYFVALGAAVSGLKHEKRFSREEVLAHLEKMLAAPNRAKQNHLSPLFTDVEEYCDFRKRHETDHAEHGELAGYEGELFLGLDAGSTTTKAVLIDSEKRIRYTHYGSNHGSPLNSAIELLKDLYAKLPPNARISGAGVTGYGEYLLKAALNFDIGEVETVAHYRAAAYFCPEVSFILDIGGQDMKCIYVNDGVIDKIVLNEACSSGCGSFLETFAASLGLPIEEFARKAIYAKSPVDLGSRCTVFMNSKIRQAQKEGNDLADISAGLAYSVIRNALYKVIKINSPEELGDHVVVQGGTFLNDAVLRAFEKTIDRNVVRADIAGLMGAFGIALIALEDSLERSGNAKETESSALISPERLTLFEPQQKTARCAKCSNRCVISVTSFDNGKKYVSGNRCEKGAGNASGKKKAENLFDYKLKRLFDHYEPLPPEKAYRGTVGIPRALNIFEDYPLWFTFWTELGYRVELSDPSARELYNSGLESISSQALCYPAKMVHGHIVNLIGKGIRTIFYPALPFERKEFEKVDHQYNCPVVASYPEVVRLNMDVVREKNVNFVQPFLPLQEPIMLAESLVRELPKYGIRLPAAEIRKAAQKGFREMLDFRAEIRRKGEELYAKVKESGETAIVLAGRPYHLDSAINHGIPEVISGGLGVPVFTEDSVSHLGNDFRVPMRVTDQWVYHGRVYRAANFVAQSENLLFVQLNSFGCGIDAITTEEAEKILAVEGKNYTVLKIDEGSNLGAVRIRIRSLMATIRNRKKDRTPVVYREAAKFTPEMKPNYTILCPEMAPLHFRLLRECMLPYGYDLVVLPEIPGSIEEGLRYVNNDACYPAIVTIGQLIAALKSGKYDPERTAMIMSQTVGGCRSTNYATLLKNAVIMAGYPQVPIITLNISDTSGQVSGFKVETGMLHRILMGLSYGDLLLRVSNATRPYELEKGSVNALMDRWYEKILPNIANISRREYLRNIPEIVADFDSIPLKDVPRKQRVGVVGEILIKYHPGGNNDLVGTIEREGGEAVVPDLLDFWIYCLLSDINRHKYLGGSLKDRLISEAAYRFVEFYYRRPLRKALAKSKRFHPFMTTRELQDKVEGVVSVCNQVGEGWLLVAEMIELLDEGVENIVCIQPFACLPNHITGRGVMKELKKRYPFANLLSMDFDPGISEVNQLNRIRLMMGTSREMAAGGF